MARDLQQAPGSVRDGQINELAAGKGKAAAAGRLEPSKYLLGPLDLGLGRGENLMQGVQLTRMDRRLTEKPNERANWAWSRSPAVSSSSGKTLSMGGSIPAARDTRTRYDRA